MRANSKLLYSICALGMVLALATGNVLADKPSWAGGGKHKEEKSHSTHSTTSVQSNTSINFQFSIDDRTAVVNYYGAQASKGNCPPGLAKKNNGCQPPGQAKKWHVGQPLDKDVVVYDLPKEVRVLLPAPPINHRYVQIAGDILLIAVGTSMVVDAIQDITR